MPDDRLETEISRLEKRVKELDAESAARRSTAMRHAAVRCSRSATGPRPTSNATSRNGFAGG